MPATELKGKEVAVLGAGGRSGSALVKYLCASGARVTAYDERPETELRRAFSDLGDCPFTLDAGHTEPKQLEKMDLVLVTPGISSDVPYLKSARQRGTPVWGEVEFSARHLSAPILAVTGTNGKSTTTSLLGHILSAWGKDVFTGGNLGDPLIHAADRDFDFIVAEVSSFQLETVDQFHPRVGVLLNLSPNHLDRHKTMENYAAMKARLFARMAPGDRAILSAEDENCRKIAASIQADVWLFATSDRVKADIVVRNSAIELVNGECVSLAGWKLKGNHNLENALAAVAAASAVGCPTAVIEKALASFRGLPHRLEDVGSIRGVQFYNDSKSTTPAAAIRALESLDAPVLWLAGGRSKGANYDALARASQRTKEIILFGEAVSLMKPAFGDRLVQVRKSMREAFDLALEHASPGDVVLLSPANASFDEFKDFEERGDIFRKWVNEAGQK